jgi:hypothetical protein
MGLEPILIAPKAIVLPLHYTPKLALIKIKSIFMSPTGIKPIQLRYERSVLSLNYGPSNLSLYHHVITL